MSNRFSSGVKASGVMLIDSDSIRGSSSKAILKYRTANALFSGVSGAPSSRPIRQPQSGCENRSPGNVSKRSRTSCSSRFDRPPKQGRRCGRPQDRRHRRTEYLFPDVFQRSFDFTLNGSRVGCANRRGAAPSSHLDDHLHRRYLHLEVLNNRLSQLLAELIDVVDVIDRLSYYFTC